jgi:hypothetical protein
MVQPWIFTGQLVTFIPHFINLGGTVDTKESVSLSWFCTGQTAMR